MRRLATALPASVLFSVFFVFSIASGTARAQAQDAVVEGVISVKFEPAATATVQAATNARGVVVQTSAQGVPLTGLSSIDQLNRQFNTVVMERIFRPAGTFEAQHRKFGLHRWYTVRFAAGTDVATAVAAYRADPNVMVAELKYEKEFKDGYVPGETRVRRVKRAAARPAASSAMSVTNDPFYSQQWHYNNTGQVPPGGTPDADIDLPEAHNIEMGDPSVIVSVHDGGIDVDHEDLAANIWVNEDEIPGNDIDDDNNGYVDDVHGYNFVSDQGVIVADMHGTHVAGTVAAVNNNGIGVAGIAGGNGSPDSGVRLMSMQVFEGENAGGFAETYAYAADNGAVISQNSWGYTQPGAIEQVVLDAIDYYIATAGGPDGPMDGGLVIFAAGNANDDGEWYPGFYEPTIAVAATGIDDQKAGYSNFGTWVDLSAPGGNGLPYDENDVFSTFPNDQYGYIAGTSMACPHVSGVAALIASHASGITNEQARTLLINTTDDISEANPGFEGLLGSGRLNAFNALEEGEVDETPPATVTDLAATATGANIELTWTAPPDDAGDPASGAVSSYQIRYSTTGPITDTSSFANATPVPNPPVPAEPGTVQTLLIEDLDFQTQYWFALVSYDELTNVSPVSNSPSATTGAAPVLAYNPDSLSTTLETNADTTLTLTLSNEGPSGSTLEFSFPAFAAMNLLSRPGIQKNDVSRPAGNFGYAKSEEDSYAGAGHPVPLGAGGPDAFGYTWIDSDEPGGPAFDWFDISEIGTPVELGDEETATAPLPFPFEFYGEQYTEVVIASNGYLSFSSIDPEFTNAPIPDPDAPNALIAAFWDDLDPGEGGGQVDYYHDQANSRFIVQYTDVQEFAGDSTETFTFQILLSEDGAIRYQYLDMESGGDLLSSTVGIENGEGDVGLQVAFNPETAYIHDSLAVAIANVPEFIASVNPAGGALTGGQSQDVDVVFTAADTEPGIYERTLALLTNDPDAPVTNVPARLTVQEGPPEIAVTPTTLDFGPVFVGGEASRTFTIVNTGAGPLEVTAVNPDNPTFTTSVVDSTFVVPFSDSVEVTVTFAPGAVAPEEGTITIESNDPDEPSLAVVVMGEGIPAPVLTTTPDSLSQTVEVNETATDVLTVGNAGGSPLAFEALFTLDPADSLTRADVSAPAPAGRPALAKQTAGMLGAAYTPDATPQRAQQPLAPMDAPYQLDDGTSENSLGLGGLGDTFDMMWLNAFEVVEHFGNITSISTTWGADGSTGAPPVGKTGLALVYEDPNDDGDPSDAVLLSQTEITVQAPATNTFTTVAIDPTPVEGTFFIAVLLENNDPESFPAPMDESSTFQEASWFVGTATGEDFNIEDLSANSIPPTFLGDAGLPANWLLRADGGATFVTVSPDSGTAAPDAELDLTVTYDATDLDPGTYDGAVVVASNDPITPTTEVPTTFEVIFGDPSIATNPTDLDFGDVFVGDTRVLPLTILNTGNGPLQVLDLISDSQVFTTDVDSAFTLPVGASDTVDVAFSPTALQSYTGTLTIVSNDPDAPTIEIGLSGTGAPPPVVAVEPDSLSETLQTGLTETDVLTVSNTGENSLDFTAMFTLAPPDSLTRADVAASSPVSRAKRAESPFASAAGAPGKVPATPLPLDAQDATYQLDDGTTENGLGIPAGGFDIMWLNAFEVVEGFGTITTIYSAYGWSEDSGLPDNRPATAYVYEDPDDDGIPDDAELLAKVDFELKNPHTDMFTAVDMGAVPVQGTFFVAILYPDQQPNQFPVPMDESSGSMQSSWLADAPAGTFDDENLSNNRTLSLIDDLGFPSNLLLRADGGATFVSVSPDSGRVAPGASMNLTVTYDATDLDPGIYAGAVVVASNDPVTPTVEVPTTMTVVPTLTITPEPGPDSTRTVPASQEFLVPITVNTLDDLGVEGYQFTLTFADVLFEPVGVETEGTLSENTILAVNTTVPGQISVAALDTTMTTAATDAPGQISVVVPAEAKASSGGPTLFTIEGSGTLLYVKLRAKSGVGASSELAFSEFIFNEGDPPVMTETTTYKVVPLYGDVSLNGKIAGNDVRLVLKYLAGKIDLSEPALTAGDVTGNGALSTYDAFLIKEYVKGDIDCFPVEEGCGAPQNRPALALKSKQTGPVGTLAWGTPERAEVPAAAASNAVIAKGAASSGPLLRVPLVLQEANGSIMGVKLTTKLDLGYVTVEKVETHLPDGWIMTHKVTEDGLLKIAMAGTTPLDGGRIGTVTLRWTQRPSDLALGKFTNREFSLGGEAVLNEAEAQTMKDAKLTVIPEEFAVTGNFPNPFSRETQIAVNLPEDAKVTIQIYDVLGRRVMVLREDLEAGTGRLIHVDGSRLSSGNYFYRIRANMGNETHVETGRMVLVK